jgi:hypothetical protein
MRRIIANLILYVASLMTIVAALPLILLMFILFPLRSLIGLRHFAEAL